MVVQKKKLDKQTFLWYTYNMIEDPKTYIKHQLAKFKGQSTEKQVYGLNAIYAVLEHDLARHSIKLLIDECIKENIRETIDKLRKEYE